MPFSPEPATAIPRAGTIGAAAKEDIGIDCRDSAFLLDPGSDRKAQIPADPSRSESAYIARCEFHGADALLPDSATRNTRNTTPYETQGRPLLLKEERSFLAYARGKEGRRDPATLAQDRDPQSFHREPCLREYASDSGS